MKLPSVRSLIYIAIASIVIPFAMAWLLDACGMW
jgi:hypothetical protein